MKGIDQLAKFKNYYQYLKWALEQMPRGAKSKLADHLNCRSAYISRVLTGRADFSEEQAVLSSEFLGHNGLETQYFLLMVQYERAGHYLLKDHLQGELNAIRKEQTKISSRIRSSESDIGQQKLEYYSHWIYSAIHILVSVPRYQTLEKMSKRLGFPVSRIQTTCHRLVDMGLIAKQGKRYVIGKRRIHLKPDSLLITKHHTNWRTHTISSFMKESSNPLHYSSAISLSLEDAEKIRGFILGLIEKKEKVISETDPEEIFQFSVDFYQL